MLHERSFAIHRQPKMKFQLFTRSPLARQNRKQLLLHALVWTAFIAYELISVFYVRASMKGLAPTLVFYVLNISLFYIHAYIVLPYISSLGKIVYPAAALLVLAEIACSLLLKYLVEHYLMDFRLPWKDTLLVSRYLFFGTWRALYFLGFSTAYWLTRRLLWYRSEKAESEQRELLLFREKALAEKDLADARFAFLQEQISPHFVFNTLNFVYNSVYQVSPAAGRSILQLAEIMRYSVQGYGQSGRTLLSAEVSQLRNLVAMNRTRYDFELYLDYTETGDYTGLEIIPLVLLTFMENVFKHGNLKDRSHPARVSLSVDEGRVLTFVTLNLKKNAPGRPAENGTGLQNALKRLEYAYYGRYRLETGEENGAFKLELMIRL